MIKVDGGGIGAYTGSLATLLWRRVLREHDTEPDLGEFTRLGLLTVPAALIVAVVALWAVAPALACFALAPCHQCCRAMMTDCDLAIIAAHPCCQLESSNAAVPPTPAAATNVQSCSSQTTVSVDLPDLSVGAVHQPNPSEAPPPRSPSGASTILRI